MDDRTTNQETKKKSSPKAQTNFAIDIQSGKNNDGTKRGTVIFCYQHGPTSSQRC